MPAPSQRAVRPPPAGRPPQDPAGPWMAQQVEERVTAAARSRGPDPRRRACPGPVDLSWPVVQDDGGPTNSHPGDPVIKKLIIVLALVAIGGLVAKKVTSN